MATSWIPTGADSSRLPPQVRQLVNLVQDAQALAAYLKNVMAQMLADDGTYALLAASFNVPAVDGQALHDVVGSASVALQATDLLALVSRLG